MANSTWNQKNNNALYTPQQKAAKSFTSATWDPWTYPVDYVLVQNLPSPGICEIVDAADERDYDEVKGYGLSGAWCRFKGKKLARWSIKLRLYGPDDYREWNQWREVVGKLPTQRMPNALDIWHPQLEELHIKSFQLLKLPQAVQESDGVWSVDIKCIEFRKPKPMLSVAEASDESKPQTWREKKITDLTGQAQVLANHKKPVGP